MPKKIDDVERCYDNKGEAVRAAQRLNKKKKVYIVIEESTGVWLVVHINRIVRGNIKIK